MDKLENLILAAFLIVVGLVSVLAIAALVSGLRRQHRQRREITGPDGVWSTRIHWAHPEISLGVARSVFDRPLFGRGRQNIDQRDGKPGPGPATDSKKAGSKKNGWFDLADLFFGFDEGALVFAGLLALVGLVVAAIVFVLLAVELAFFLLLFALFSARKLIMGHPWTIEAIAPDSRKHHIEVVGFRQAREEQRRLVERIEAGVFTLT